MISRHSLLYVLLCGPTLSTFAQEHEFRDTLQAAQKTDIQNRTMVGEYLLANNKLNQVVSPTGILNIYSHLQLVPGVSWGGEGSTSYYVRGGNLGGNKTSLDGVQIFGTGHMLGLTSSFPSELLSRAVFQVSNFTGDCDNFTSSILQLQTTDSLINKTTAHLSISNFMLCSDAQVPIISKKLSLIASFRISPIGLQYKTITKHTNLPYSGLSNLNASIYDVYLKGIFALNKKNSINATYFKSFDSYSYSLNEENGIIGWNNYFTSLDSKTTINSTFKLYNKATINVFSNWQGLQKRMANNENNLAISNKLTDYSLISKLDISAQSAHHVFIGMKLNLTDIKPGSAFQYIGDEFHFNEEYKMKEITQRSFQASLFADYSLKMERVSIHASGRLNAFSMFHDGMSEYKCYKPEFSISIKRMLGDYLSIDGAYDHRCQFVHSLEGLPIGWSTEMLISSDASKLPEEMSQWYLGAAVVGTTQKLTLGAYIKSLDNLLWCKEATHYFTSSMSGWENQICIGKGTSKGIEMMYSISTPKAQGSIAYTLSKTDRLFPDINNAIPFPAKYDRRHVASFNATYLMMHTSSTRLSLSLTSIFQSGHHETTRRGLYSGYLLDGQEISIPYFGQINNFQMPSYFRTDIGVNIEIKRRLLHSITFGIYNMTNKHNPFFIIYNQDEKDWQTISIIPIMPSVRYTISF